MTKEELKRTFEERKKTAEYQCPDIDTCNEEPCCEWAPCANFPSKMNSLMRLLCVE